MNLLKHKKKIIATVLLGCVGYAWSCVAAIPNQAPPMVPERSAWIVYWDWQQGLEQALVREDQALVAFAAHFNKHNHITLPKGLDVNALQQGQEFAGRRFYLSFVNDKEAGKGVSLKDVQLLHRLLDKETVRHRHIAEIVKLSKEKGFTGIEIDYENLWQEEALVKSYAQFARELKSACDNNGLKLRLVLEPKTLAYAELLPEKVEYVVMFYNLYGPHSGPGPKANEKFIMRTLKQMEKLCGTTTIAFANGGFDWAEGGRVSGLTQGEAEALVRKYQVNPERDKASRALYFSYSIKDEVHTVWYADELTLAFWRNIAEKYGYQRFSLWRL
ncbi:MAG: glycosyl hydrolase family 18 protein [Phascolarctobacterium sp.]|nr:glycosyl hydrolase family 18 protein [Phascolarctobacterium sp.]